MSKFAFDFSHFRVLFHPLRKTGTMSENNNVHSKSSNINKALEGVVSHSNPEGRAARMLCDSKTNLSHEDCREIHTVSDGTTSPAINSRSDDRRCHPSSVHKGPSPSTPN